VSDGRDIAAEGLARRHLRFGWTAILVFGLLGLVLEVLHGFKVRAYLDGSNDTRRLMWTLAHAHGTLLGLVNVLYGLTVARFADWGHGTLPSRGLLAAAVLLPAGFFLGGLQPYGGDPGFGIVLVPLGAVALVVAVGALVLSRPPATPPPSGSKSARR
jgi:peptidoglycan/LPS O-acetylase OafA/YrhL